KRPHAQFLLTRTRSNVPIGLARRLSFPSVSDPSLLAPVSAFRSTLFELQISPRPVKTAFLLTFFSLSLFAHAQHQHDAPPQSQPQSTTEPPQSQPAQHDHSAMQMDHSQHGSMDSMSHEPETLVDQTLLRATAGTAAAPLSTPFHMLMKERFGWRWMLHSNFFVNALQQS